MKNSSLLFVVFAMIGLAFTDPTSEMVSMSVDTENSFVKWTASKVTGTHYGKVMVKSGNLEYTDGSLTGGTVVMDMTSITVEDIQGKGAERLAGHLRSPDFFGVEENPTAEFKITNVVSRGKAGEYRITGDMTIKGFTEEVKFNTVLTEEGNSSAGVATITLDRTDYDIRYGSGSFFENLGDRTIYDEFELEINLIANK